MKILITGGAGYIGSHTCVELLAAGHEIVVVDNFCNAKPEAARRVKALAGKDFPVETCDILDPSGLQSVFEAHNIEAVIHFAGLKAVGESVERPLEYYRNNVVGTYNLLAMMAKHDVHKLVFSSSATVYGDPVTLPYTEHHPLSPTNPYGRTKLMVEDMLRDLHVSNPQWQISILRYFNPCGAHASGQIGEDPNGIPNNLMPFVAQVASGRRKELAIFGHDYDTPDGTGVRDYIHVVDLADAHVRAVLSLDADSGCKALNLGTGQGRSVLDVVKSFARASGREIPYVFAPRRAGDLPRYFADASLAQKALGWRATRDLDTMCADHWRWQAANPDGY